VNTALFTFPVTITRMVYGDEVDKYNQPLVAEDVFEEVMAYLRWIGSTTEMSVRSDEIVVQVYVPGRYSGADNVVSIQIDGIEYLIEGQPLTQWNPRTQEFEYTRFDLRVK
jgi:hypothetical protein